MRWNPVRPAKEMLADLEKSAALRAVYQAQKDLAAYWMEHFSDSPDAIGGWTHNAVCPDCAETLRYDREKPREHVCPRCGKAYDSPEIREAWNAFRRSDILAGVWAAALCHYLEGEEAYRAFVLRVLGYYADTYDQFEEHGRWVGLAKLTSQSLDEAVWGIRAVQSLMLAEVDPFSPQAQHIKKRLLVPLARLVMSQPTNLMNISLWHAACSAGVGVYYQDVRFLYPYWKPNRRIPEGEPLDYGAIYERNGARLLMENITDDGLWRENSISYHYYALSAALAYYCFLKQASLPKDDPIGAGLMRAFADERLAIKLRKAFAAPLSLLYPDGQMPATSDGWKYSLAQVQDTYKLVCRLFEGAPEHDLFAAVLYAYGEPEVTVSTLLYGQPEDPGYDLFTKKSTWLDKNKMAMLRNEEACVFFKYGNLCAGHSHPDALELSIFPFAMDPGSLNYGAAIHGEYFYVIGSHSTFVIDGDNQYRAACGTAEMARDGLFIAAEVADAYPGVTARRALRLDGPVLHDDTQVTCEEPRQIDWLFHGAGDFSAAGDFAPATLPETTNGYQHFKQVRRFAGGPFHAEWTVGEKRLALDLPAIPGAEIYVAQTPDNPLDQKRHAILVRKQGDSLHVPAVFTLSTQAASG